MQFTILTLIAAASAAAASPTGLNDHAAMSGCDQGYRPDHNAPLDFFSSIGPNGQYETHVRVHDT